MQKAPYFVGLDIGTANVRCVIGMLEHREAENHLSVIGLGMSANHGMRKGAVVHVEEVAASISEAIAEAERMAGVRIRGATINVNGAHIHSQTSHGVVAISTPTRQISDDDRLRVEEAATVINLPANREIIQVFAKNYRIDGQDNIKDPVGMQGVRLEVETLVVTAGTPLLRTLDTALERAQVPVHNHTVASLAAAEAVLERRQKESGTAVIDIGAGTTNVVILDEGEVEHVAVIPIGSQHLTNDLAIGLKTDLEIAELVKLAHATLDFTNPPAEAISVEFEGKRHKFAEKTVRLVVESRVDELLEQVDREFRKAGKSRKLPGGVVIVGGMANMPGIAEYTRERLQLPAKKGKVTSVSGIISSVESPEYATAVGLMMLDMILSDSSPNTSSIPGSQVTAGLFNKFKQITSRK
jgi:cell division protein FtsA